MTISVYPMTRYHYDYYQSKPKLVITPLFKIGAIDIADSGLAWYDSISYNRIRDENEFFEFRIQMKQRLHKTNMKKKSKAETERKECHHKIHLPSSSFQVFIRGYYFRFATFDCSRPFLNVKRHESHFQCLKPMKVRKKKNKKCAHASAVTKFINFVLCISIKASNKDITKSFC